MQIKDIIHFLEKWAPPSLQESYDNSGLIIGDGNKKATRAIITLDVTEDVIDEAVSTESSLIIAHHPLIFFGMKKIGTSHWVDRCIRKAIKHDINIYALHTNLDSVASGVNNKIAEKIGLKNLSILSPKPNTLLKLSVFVPPSDKENLLTWLYDAGAGEIGNYDHCSFQSSGEGTFRANEHSNPSIGEIGKDEIIPETRIEVILPAHKKCQVLKAMRESHPYEEIAYYLSSLVNENQEAGSGMTGVLEKEVESAMFLEYLKQSMNLRVIRHTGLVRKKIKKVAVCGGAGSFLLTRAITSKADIFITSDVKYHEFFEANNQIIIADIGHYESEVFTKELIQEKLTKNFAKLAFRLSEAETNPIKYL